MIQNYQSQTKGVLFIGLLALTSYSSPGVAGFEQTEPVEYLIDFEITGTLNPQTGTYTISGPGFAPLWVFGSGEIIDKRYSWRETAQLSGGEIAFNNAPTDPVVDFTCLPGGCNITLKDGAVFTSDAGVPLSGRAINKWGPVFQSPDFDPVNGVFPIRILGCGGLKEIAGEGKAAGMVGSICFNGVLNFDQNNPFVLSGSSKCTITVHTPAPGVVIE